jgi:ADP-ribose pyrophosphatase YjhB (NUDIX family)
MVRRDRRAQVFRIVTLDQRNERGNQKRLLCLDTISPRNGCVYWAIPPYSMG